MPDIPAEAAIRADERARIAAWLRELVASRFNLGVWLHGGHGMTVGAGPGAVLKAVIADLESAGVGSPVSCPSAAPESTQSPETTSVAPVYRSGVERPAETLSALRDRIARAIAHRAGSQAFDHTDRAWADLRNRWLSYADAALAALDGAGAVPEHTGSGKQLPTNSQQPPDLGATTEETNQ